MSHAITILVTACLLSKPMHGLFFAGCYCLGYWLADSGKN